MLALEKSSDDLLMRKQRGEDVRGNALINTSLGYDDIGPVNEEHMLPLLERLFNEFQAVIVVAAGNDAEDWDLETRIHPAAFAKLPNFPIISVRGVGFMGERVAWSRGLSDRAPNGWNGSVLRSNRTEPNLFEGKPNQLKWSENRTDN